MDTNGNKAAGAIVSQGTRDMARGRMMLKRDEVQAEYDSLTKRFTELATEIALLKVSHFNTAAASRAKLVAEQLQIQQRLRFVKPALKALNRQTDMGQSQTLNLMLNELTAIRMLLAQVLNDNNRNRGVE